ncbi:MAG: class I SAM-dependent methyltransferase [Betaproteobacteria bacterium]|nr:class I SAM-dependent methyltransferase [Betaproteobacteria bacterium]
MSVRIRMLFMVVLAAAFASAAAVAQEGRGDVIYVPTPQVAVDEMLRMARVGPKDFVIDLGSGDGRIVITAAQKFGARGFGVDLDTYLLKMARENAKQAGVADRVQFYERNLFETDLSQATVITSYLLPEMNERLRPKILALKPGTRVAAHDYDMGEWYPDEQKTLIVPEKTVGDPGKSYVFFWIVPALIAGEWESLIPVGGRGVIYEFDFDQSFQKVSGDVRADGKDVRLPLFNVRGDEVRFEVDVPQGAGMVKHRFEGRIKQDAIEGTVTIGAGQKPLKWTARLKKRGEMRMTALDATLGALR